MNAVNAGISSLKKKILVMEVLVESDTLSEAREIAIDQCIAADTTRLTGLKEERRELRWHQKGTKKSMLFVSDKCISSLFLRE